MADTFLTTYDSINEPHQTKLQKNIKLYIISCYIPLIKMAVNQILILERKITYKQRVSE